MGPDIDTLATDLYALEAQVAEMEQTIKALAEQADRSAQLVTVLVGLHAEEMAALREEGAEMMHACPHCGRTARIWTVEYRAEMSCHAHVNDDLGIELVVDTPGEQSTSHVVVICPACHRTIERWAP